MKKMTYGTVSALALLIAMHAVAIADTASNDETSAVTVGNDNSSEDSFRDAKGAIQSQQNASTNSSASQNMSITAKVFGDARSDAATESTVENDNAARLKVDSQNSLGDRDFNHAAGAIQVQQNASVNSVASQNTSISATVFGDAASDAVLVSSVTHNYANYLKVTGPNSISDSFRGVRGAVSVQQNNSVNSAVNQQLSIAASFR